MTGYKNFAVVGAGLIGIPIIEELLNAKSSGKVDKVILLTRTESASKYEALAARGATVVAVDDYSSVPDVTKALSGVEVVIATLAHAAADLQIPIAEAAKAAGVQLFAPAEFGSNSDNVTEGVNTRKPLLNKKIQEFLPTVRFLTGAFIDYVWSPYLNLDLKSGSVGVGGDGNAKASFTARPDIARYVAYVLTTLPPAELKNRIFRLEAERASLNEAFAAYEKKHGVKLQVKYTPVEELEEKVKKNPQDIVSLLHIMFAKGLGTVGSPIDNDVYPDWNPKPILHYL